MSKWGKGWEVGINKALHKHQQTMTMASVILEAEHGIRHKEGERIDLCPKCLEFNERKKK